MSGLKEEAKGDVSLEPSKSTPQTALEIVKLQTVEQELKEK